SMTVPRWTVADTLLAVALAVVGVVGTIFADQNPDTDRALDAIGVCLVVVAALTLAVRRRWPLITFAVVTVLTSSYLIAGYIYGPIMVSFLVAVYTAARHLPLARSLPAALIALPLILAHI